MQHFIWGIQLIFINIILPLIQRRPLPCPILKKMCLEVIFFPALFFYFLCIPRRLPRSMFSLPVSQDPVPSSIPNHLIWIALKRMILNTGQFDVLVYKQLRFSIFSCNYIFKQAKLYHVDWKFVIYHLVYFDFVT